MGARPGDSVRDGARSVRHRSRETGIPTATRMAQAPGLRRYSMPVSRRTASGSSFNARSNSRAPARVFVAQGPRFIGCQGNGMGCRLRRRRRSGMVAGRGPALLLVESRRLSMPVGAASRPVTKKPTGSPLAIQHFHSRGLSWRNLYLGAPDISVARDKIVFNLGEHSGNVWLTDLPPADGR